jgi:hypothetical protein
VGVEEAFTMNAKVPFSAPMVQIGGLVNAFANVMRQDVAATLPMWTRKFVSFPVIVGEVPQEDTEGTGPPVMRCPTESISRTT